MKIETRTKAIPAPRAHAKEVKKAETRILNSAAVAEYSATAKGYEELIKDGLNLSGREKLILRIEAAEAHKSAAQFANSEEKKINDSENKEKMHRNQVSIIAKALQIPLGELKDLVRGIENRWLSTRELRRQRVREEIRYSELLRRSKEGGHG